MREESLDLIHRWGPQTLAAPLCSPLPNGTFFSQSKANHKVSPEINLSRVPPITEPLWTRAAVALALLGHPGRVPASQGPDLLSSKQPADVDLPAGCCQLKCSWALALLACTDRSPRLEDLLHADLVLDAPQAMGWLWVAPGQVIPGVRSPD